MKITSNGTWDDTVIMSKEALYRGISKVLVHYKCNWYEDKFLNTIIGDINPIQSKESTTIDINGYCFTISYIDDQPYCTKDGSNNKIEELYCEFDLKNNAIWAWYTEVINNVLGIPETQKIFITNPCTQVTLPSYG